jgi:transcriptional regulator with XRE-family HTH domain
MTIDVAKTSGQQTEAPPLRIGARLRHARLRGALRLKDVAMRAGCSESMLSKIENDRAVPSLTALHRLCQVLDLSVSALMAEEPVRPWTIMKPHERARIGYAPRRADDSHGTRAEVLVPYSDGRLLEGFIVEIEPGGNTGGFLQHAGEEVGYVLEGLLELNIEDEVMRLQPGDSFYFRSDLRHAYGNPGDAIMRAVWINTPPTF